MFQTGALTGPRRAVTMMLPLGAKHEIPALGYGTYRLDQAIAAGAVEYAIECGFRHIDCAKVYGNQAQVGEGIAAGMKRFHLKRDALFVTGKLWPTDQHPDHVEAAVRQTLSELKTDYLDLFLVHWPIAWRHTGRWETPADIYPKTTEGKADVDTTVTLLDTWRAMEKLVDKGLVKCLGLSNAGASDFDALVNVTHSPLANQFESHPALQQHVLRSRMVRDGMMPVCYCPLAMPTRFTPPEYKGICETEYLQRLADLTGFTAPRMVLNWAVDNHNAVLVKAASKEHIRANAKVSTCMLSDPQRRMIQAYETMHGSVRVINPKDFTADGTPFFKD
jgi:diketogulonate reductase-like aldo/keto reductase